MPSKQKNPSPGRRGSARWGYSYKYRLTQAGINNEQRKLWYMSCNYLYRCRLPKYTYAAMAHVRSKTISTIVDNWKQYLRKTVPGLVDLFEINLIYLEPEITIRQITEEVVDITHFIKHVLPEIKKAIKELVKRIKNAFIEFLELHTIHSRYGYTIFKKDGTPPKNGIMAIRQRKK